MNEVRRGLSERNFESVMSVDFLVGMKLYASYTRTKHSIRSSDVEKHEDVFNGILHVYIDRRTAMVAVDF